MLLLLLIFFIFFGVQIRNKYVGGARSNYRERRGAYRILVGKSEGRKEKL
jgi:hypothetical protein